MQACSETVRQSLERDDTERYHEQRSDSEWSRSDAVSKYATWAGVYVGGEYGIWICVHEGMMRIYERD